MKFKIIAFYKFLRITNCQVLQKYLFNVGEVLELRGTILIAPEGINATIAGKTDSINKFIQLLNLDPRFFDLRINEAFYQHFPFKKWKVKIKSEILTFGVPDINPAERVGTYVKPQEWNALIHRHDITLVDTRNTYEISLGTFPSAINPRTKNFTDFKSFVQSELRGSFDKKIALFCTGGIRCEKASSYMLTCGFKEVYHLEGGILKYLEEIDPNESLWKGACFVFDERVSVTHGLLSGGHKLCRCGMPVLVEERDCQICKQQRIATKAIANLNLTQNSSELSH